MMLGSLVLVSSLIAQAHVTGNCDRLLLTKEELAGARLLHRRDPRLHRSRLVTRSLVDHPADRLAQPERRIARWLKALEVDEGSARQLAHNRIFNLGPTRRLSQGYFDKQARLARDRGYGDLVLDEGDQAEEEAYVQADQAASIAGWLDYLSHPDSATIPAWVKYWVITSILKMGVWDPQKQRFGSRGPGQAALFPELNREALALVVDRLLSSRDVNFGFAKAYGRAFAECTRVMIDRDSTNGIWRHFPAGSDHQDLVAAIRGRGTGWCTVGAATARTQLHHWDFHIYFTRDANHDPVIPRLAIRLEGTRVAEVRGVANDQNIDEGMAQTEILALKLREFGTEGERWIERDRHMRCLARLDRMQSEGVPFSIEDLRFLYEIDGPIEGFGYEKDPRIQDIIAARDRRHDPRRVMGDDSEGGAAKVLPEADQL